MGQSTALAKGPGEQFIQIQSYLLGKQKAIANVAPKYFDTERMVRLALGASSRAPQLLECSPNSWLMALMDCAFYGLEPNPALGHAYLVPFRNNKLQGRPLEVQFIVGYKGLILLACETGGFDDVEARIVYENELSQGRFEEVPADPSRPFVHRPLYTDRGAPAGAYAVGWRGVDKRPRFLFMPKEDIFKCRDRSRAAKKGPWVTDEGAMWKKTVVRRMLALAPLKARSSLDTALQQDEVVEGGDLARAQDWPRNGPVIDADVVDEPPHDPETGVVDGTENDEMIREPPTKASDIAQRPLGF